jgi:hypothetical protein
MSSTATYNTNESVTLFVKARIDSREMMDFVSKAANEAVANNTSMPDEFSDIFTLQIITRPSGSKYGILDFA